MSEAVPALITGSGVLTAIGCGVEGFAAALRAGDCGITARAGVAQDDLLRPWLSADLPPWNLQEHAERHSPTLAAAASRLARRASATVRASVAVALEAWGSADLDANPVASERIGVIVAGSNLNGRGAEAAGERYAASPAHLSSRHALQYLDTDHVATVSALLGVRGEGATVGAASASGNVAVVHGARLLASGAADVCLVIGALTDLSSVEQQAYFNLGAMAGATSRRPATESCRPFDAAREGFVPAEGAACLVLETAESADRRGVRALALLLGSAVRLDGTNLPEPSVAGEVRAMREALRAAGITADEVDYVNAHGTASALGDSTEIAALAQVFGPDGPWINSTKGLTGHCLCAAGVVEAVATIIQLQQGFVHPNRNLVDPIDSRCRLVGGAARDTRLRTALSNGFGFGGFNSSLVLAAA